MALLLIPAVVTTAGFSSPRRGVSDPDTCQISAAPRIEAAYAAWLDLLRRRDALPREEFLSDADALVRRTFDVRGMGLRIFGQERWNKLSDHQRDRFAEALVRSLRARLLAKLGDAERAPRLETADGSPEVQGRDLELPFALVREDGRDALSVRVAAGTDGVCRVVDIREGDRALLPDLEKRIRQLEHDYSFAYMVAELGDYDFVVLEDFESTPVGELPVGWTWRGSDAGKNKPYRVRDEHGNRYLQATDEGESVILGHKVRWNLDEYPYVSFRVRVWEIPEGGDERFGDKVDSAAGIYFTLRKKFFGKIPESIKYVWSSTLPVGAAVRRDGIGKPWQVVFGTDRKGIGEWHTYVFDLRQAYSDTFGGDAPSKPEGIGVLSDANSLMARAYADYDDIRALRTAPPDVTSGVREILPAEGHDE